MKQVDAIRVLSIDMIEKAESGHPGIALGAAPMMYELYAKWLKIYNKESDWINRDRFVLSAGHGSSMLYATLHLSGYKISMEDLQEFRQIGSVTPGHPEVDDTDGVDSTSGPLGQGLAQGAGMALAEAHLAAKFNKEDLKIIDHYTYVLCGDGDLQEGVSAEASSLAGHLKLNKLIVLWDSNDIQLDSEVGKASTEDVLRRYESYNWDTIRVEDGEDLDAIDDAIQRARKSDKPTLIEVKTIIGRGATKKAGTSEAHGAPLGMEEVDATKEFYNWDQDEFVVEEEVYKPFLENSGVQGKQSYEEWKATLKKYEQEYPEDYVEFVKSMGDKPIELEDLEFSKGMAEATRVSSGKAINNLNDQLPNLIGGSADLSKSNNSNISNSGLFGIDGDEAQNIAFGVREFGMAAMTNGIVLHGGLTAYCATFFVFSDYMKPAIRMSALQNLPSIFVFTHDSVAVGEDGPTHQPIEQLTGLRAIPNLNVIRPADANETQAAWNIAVGSSDNPTAIVLTRQNLEVVTDASGIVDRVRRGAYVITEDEVVNKTLIASGSEVKLALDVKKRLNAKGVGVKVISMPSMYAYEKQDQSYKNALFAGSDREDTYYIEMATAVEGYKYAGHVVNISEFGKSGKGEEVVKYKGFVPSEIVSKILG